MSALSGSIGVIEIIGTVHSSVFRSLPNPTYSRAWRLACQICLTALTMFGASLALADGKLNLLTEEYPPFNMSDPKNGALLGISIEKVQELMRRANQPYAMALYPWARSYQMSLQLEDTCVFSTTRTPEREPLFKWVGPLVKNNWVVYARADDSRHPKKLEDLRPFVLGGYQSDAVGEFLKHHGFKVDLANADADNPRKLLHSRFDFWATGELLGAYLIKSGGYQGKIMPLFTFKQTEMYLACNLKTPASKIEQFNQILHEMEKDGSVAAIERKYR